MKTTVKVAVLSSLGLALTSIPARSVQHDTDAELDFVALARTASSAQLATRSDSSSTLPTHVVAQVNSTKGRARRGDFDAEGKVFCAQERGQSLSVCEAAVARGDAGDAAVAVTFGNGFTRYLFFDDGRFVRASTTMSGSGKDIDFGLIEGIYKLRVDDQRFEIPSDFVLGE